MLQFIGELVFDNGSQQLVLKARVGRNVDLLDMSLYRKGEEGQVMPSLHIQLPPPNPYVLTLSALQLRRQYDKV